MQWALDVAPAGRARVLAMDVNSGICTRQPREAASACGFYGLQRANLAGERLKDWLSHNGLHAASTHFAPRSNGHGCGTWKHPRSKGTCQNDHVFVSRGHA
jgi:hypothetical protein